MQVVGDLCHDLLTENIKAKLSFDETKDFNEWKTSLREKWNELLGIERIKRNAIPLRFEIEGATVKDGYKQIRFTFEWERGAVVPCYLLIPDTGKEKYPVAITLQGHSSGFHNSIAEPKTEKEKEYALGRGAFAVQAVRNGFAALAIEQRAMGERRALIGNRWCREMCSYEALTAIQLGRTVIGERVLDVHYAIDVLANFNQLDLDNLIITGNSGGGTISFYAACFDERIKLSVPSCSFCSYKDSIMTIGHCACNYIPNASEWFEMQDLAALIAPRRLAVITGQKDEIFPIEGVRNAFETVKKIYKKAGVEDNTRLVETPREHWWCEDIVWDTLREEYQKMI